MAILVFEEEKALIASYLLPLRILRRRALCFKDGPTPTPWAPSM
jgi:hypothetical protein